ncbi:MAG TPA: flagellar hook-associated protein FlgK, partial [Methylomirabilota bacterium]|nr:flagellar hook-associated protein FlgK [Methylomirabilota bacterium]
MPLGLFGTLNLANRSLQAQRQATEVAGHNLANVNTPGYARQRVALETSLYVPSEIGPQGTGVDAVAIRQLRDRLIDGQIQSEASVRGSLEAQQKALQFAQAALGQVIDRQATGAEGSAAAGGVGGQHGLAEELSDFFNAFQSLSSNPTSMAERQVLIIKAQNLTTQFNQVDRRLDGLRTSLDESLLSDVDSANILLQDIAKLNEQIIAAEVNGAGQANDLRDIRQLKIEELAELVNLDSTETSNGGIDISVGGQTLVSGPLVLETLEVYDAGGGQMLVRSSGGTPLTLTGGTMHGTIEIRDNELTTLQTDI